MHHLRAPAAISLAILLTACATGSGGGYGSDRPPPVNPNPPAVQAHPLARSMSYTCEDLTIITMTEGQPDARAKLNSGLELALARTGPGRYGAQSYEFRPAGSEGTWINQGKALRCRVK